MFVIEFDGSQGLAVPDAVAEGYIRAAFLTDPDQKIVVGTGALLNAARVLVIEKVIPVDAIQFEFQGYTLAHNAKGRFADWPLGLDGTTDDLLERLLPWGQDT